MGMLEGFLLLALPGALILFGIYRAVRKSQEKSWEMEIGPMPDLPRLRLRFLIVFLVMQLFNAVLLSAMMHFPKQR